MRKIVVLALTLAFLIIGSTTHANASTHMPKFYDSSKDNQQIFGIFIMDLYYDEIKDAIQNYYKDQEGLEYPSWIKLKMVSIAMHERGNKILKGRHSYMLKITILPFNKEGRTLGTDTVYLAVSPIKDSQKDSPPVELVKYDHKTPNWKP